MICEKHRKVKTPGTCIICLRDELDRLTQQNKALRQLLDDWAKREIAACPGDLGFEEYIKALTERVAELEKSLKNKSAVSTEVQQQAIDLTRSIKP